MEFIATKKDEPVSIRINCNKILPILYIPEKNQISSKKKLFRILHIKIFKINK